MRKNVLTKVLFAASEAEPFYKVGGLGDYAGSLPFALKQHYNQFAENLDIRVVLPLHDKTTINKFGLKKKFALSIPAAKQENLCSVYFKEFDEIPHYFIRQEKPPLESDAVYGNDQYLTAYKFVQFSIAALHILSDLDWQPDIIHTNDWHTALINYLVKTKTGGIGSPGTLLTIHNLPFMGYGSEPVYSEFGIQSIAVDVFPAWAQNLPLPMGIASADRIVAVSPTYARELTSSYFAYGLEDYFIAHNEKLTGIINGIDYKRWNPQLDPDIAHNFSSKDLENRKKNKKELLDDLGLAYEETEALIIVISRLENQKGIDLILDALSEIIDMKWKAVILGSGHHGYEYAFRALERGFPQKLRAVMAYDPLLAKKMYGAGDMILMPSLYEPCGLSQMIAMRYGCVPIAHAVGGLKDSIKIEPEAERTGFLFEPANKDRFIDSIKGALACHAEPLKWTQIQKNGMRSDFSWARSAEKYAKIYRQIKDSKTQ